VFPELAALLDAMIACITCMAMGDYVAARAAADRMNAARERLGAMAPLPPGGG